MKKYLITTALFVVSVSVWSADPVTDAMQIAYAPYRNALFRTNSNAQAESQHAIEQAQQSWTCLLYTSPSPRDGLLSRMPSSA